MAHHGSKTGIFSGGFLIFLITQIALAPIVTQFFMEVVLKAQPKIHLFSLSNGFLSHLNTLQSTLLCLKHLK